MQHRSNPDGPSSPARKPRGQNVFGRDVGDLHEVLVALGHRPDSVVSVATQDPGHKPSFRALTWTVASLCDGVPPDDQEVWFMPNPLTLEADTPRKGSAAEVERGLTLFADLDVVTPGVKDNGFASLAECELVVKELAAAVECDPVVVVYSGHGLQPIWRVAGAPLIDDGAVAWTTTSVRWSALVRQVAQRVNPKARVDSVFNIDRVLRCPGSVNWKDRDNPVAVGCEVNADAGWLDVEALNAVLPPTDANISPAHPMASPQDAEKLRGSFREGPMTPKVRANVRAESPRVCWRLG